MLRTFLFVILLLALISTSAFFGGADCAAQEREFKPYIFPNMVGKFKPIKKFPVVSAEKTDLQDNELVLGVEIKGVARAYPINMLTGPSREILNDNLGGQAIAATW